MIGALLLAAALIAGAPDVSLKIGPEQPEVGLVMTVTLQVSGAEGADCALVDLPEIPGARLGPPMGPSHQSYTEIINGRTRQSVSTLWQFELIPEREGLLTVPSFSLTCRGDRVETTPRSFSVGPSSLVDDLVRVTITPADDTAWVGQVIDMRVELSIVETAHDMLARNGLQLLLPWLEDVPGLHMLEPPVPACSRGVMTVLPSERQIPTCTDRVRDGGRWRIVYSQTIPMLATAPGTVLMPESRFSARIVVDRGSGGQNAFGFFRNLRTEPSRTVVTDARAAGPALIIREPPREGRPVSYTNAVGRFTFSGDAMPTTLAVGESCTVSLGLSPLGGSAPQLALVEWPDFESRLREFRLFGKDDSSNTRGRVLSLEISPADEGVEQIPALEFSWFDPASESYQTASVGPFALDVSPGGRDGLTILSTPDEILNDLETIRESLPEPAGTQAPVWLGPAVALALLLAVEARQRGRRWKAAHPAAVARRGARGQLERSLRQASDVRAVAAAFAAYLAARFDGPSGGMTADEALPLVTDDELAGRLSTTVSGWEAAYLGGVPLALDAARDEARALAADLERMS